MIARALLSLAILCAAVPARAADKRAAAAHFQRGRALFDDGSWSAALDEFEAGYEAYPLPGFLVNIGQCQRKLDRLDDAAASFQKFLGANVTDARLRAEVQDALAEISEERARRQAAAEVAAIEAKRQRDEAEARHPPVVDDDARADLRLHAAPAAAVAATPGEAAATVEKQPKKSHRWVWAIVGALAVGAAASAVTVAVLQTQPPAAQPGSLGLLDGRR